VKQNASRNVLSVETRSQETGIMFVKNDGTLLYVLSEMQGTKLRESTKTQWLYFEKKEKPQA
jgi:ribosomal protein L24E